MISNVVEQTKRWHFIIHTFRSHWSHFGHIVVISIKTPSEMDVAPWITHLIFMSELLNLLFRVFWFDLFPLDYILIEIISKIVINYKRFKFSGFIFINWNTFRCDY